MKKTHLKSNAILNLKSNLKWIILPAAFAAMGIAMPSCPGQQAMQQQIETLTTTNTDLNKKVQVLTTQLNGLTNEMNQVKQILPQVTSLLTSQKTVLDQLDSSVKDLQAKAKNLKKKK